MNKDFDPSIGVSLDEAREQERVVSFLFRTGVATALFAVIGYLTADAAGLSTRGGKTVLSENDTLICSPALDPNSHHIGSLQISYPNAPCLSLVKQDK